MAYQKPVSRTCPGHALRGAFALVLLLAPSHAAAQTPGEFEPPGVFQLVARLQGELELVRLELGRPDRSLEGLAVDRVVPREVLSQARTLYAKADQLAFEHARTRVPLGEPTPPEEVSPGDVYAVVEAALARIREVELALSIPERVEAPRRDPAKTPTDVFSAILQADRLLDGLLEEPVRPGDAFEEVTEAIGRVARLLEVFPDSLPLPDAPAFERRKTCGDAFRELVVCFGLVRDVAELGGVPMLELDASHVDPARITPSDLTSLAALLVSELDHLRAFLPPTSDPLPAYYPGCKLPSHVFQRVGLLKVQLAQLQTLVKANPEVWRSRGG